MNTTPHWENVEIAICQLFKAKRKRPGCVWLNFGPQFSRVGVMLCWLILCVLLIFSIENSVNGNSTHVLLYIFLGAFPLSYMLDVRGVEFDFKQLRVRTYASFMRFKYGKWMDLSRFDRLQIMQDSYRIGRISEGSTRSGDAYFYYGLYLLDDENRYVKLLEHESVTRVRQYAEEFANMSGLNWVEEIVILNH